MSQVSTFLVTSFVEDRYKKPKNMTPGSSQAQNVIKKTTGQKMKPTYLFLHMNYYMKIICMWDGNAKGGAGHNQWERISTKAVARGARNKNQSGKTKKN